VAGAGSGAGAAVDRAILAATRALAALAGAAIAAMLAIVVAAVVMRYVVGAPFRFTEELGGLLLAASLFAALPYTLADNLHIRVTLVSERLHGRAARGAWVLGQAVLVAFCAVFAWEAWQITELTLRLALRSEQARLPLAPWLILMTASVAACGAIAAWQALRPPPSPGALRL